MFIEVIYFYFLVPFLVLLPLPHRRSSHYYLYSAFNNANCVKAALHQLDIKLGGCTSALQYLKYLQYLQSVHATVHGHCHSLAYSLSNTKHVLQKQKL